MDDAAVMRVTDRAADRHEHLQELEQRPALGYLHVSNVHPGTVLVDELRERRAAHQAHRVVDLPAFGLADIVDRDDRTGAGAER